MNNTLPLLEMPKASRKDPMLVAARTNTNFGEAHIYEQARVAAYHGIRTVMVQVIVGGYAFLAGVPLHQILEGKRFPTVSVCSRDIAGAHFCHMVYSSHTKNFNLCKIVFRYGGDGAFLNARGCVAVLTMEENGVPNKHQARFEKWCRMGKALNYSADCAERDFFKKELTGGFRKCAANGVDNRKKFPRYLPTDVPVKVFNTGCAIFIAIGEDFKHPFSYLVDKALLYDQVLRPMTVLDQTRKVKLASPGGFAAIGETRLTSDVPEWSGHPNDLAPRLGEMRRLVADRKQADSRLLAQAWYQIMWHYVFVAGYDYDSDRAFIAISPSIPDWIKLDLSLSCNQVTDRETGEKSPLGSSGIPRVESLGDPRLMTPRAIWESMRQGGVLCLSYNSEADDSGKEMPSSVSGVHYQS